MMPKKRIFLPLAVIAVLSACTQSTPSPSPSAPTLTTEPTTAPAATSVPSSVPSSVPTDTAAPPPTPEFIPYETPAWFQNGILYEIYVRSFADSDGDGIGDLNGIARKLNYLESLHVDVVWLMPIHPTTTVHGYDVMDFTAVNPEYGTHEDLVNLVAEMHSRDMRLIIDFVSSHVSNRHPYFEDALGNLDSPYAEWFHFTNDAHTTYQAFGGFAYLPRLNHFNPEVVEHLKEAALFWMDLDGDGDYTDGIDGFRIDNATFPPPEYFVEWRQAIKRANPEALVLGEVWVEQPQLLGPYFTDQFDALFNFPMLTLLANGGAIGEDGEYEWTMPPSLITSRVVGQEETYPEAGILVQFFSNHDTDRLASEVGGDVAIQKLAAAVTLILPEAFALYYGEEIGMFGTQGGPPHYDSYRREPMDWYADQAGPLQTTWFQVPDRRNVPGDGVSVEEQEGDPDSLLSFYRFLLELKATLPALQGGDFVDLDAAAIGRKAWAVARVSETQTLVGIYNFGPDAVSITIPAFPITSDVLVDLIAGAEFPGSVEGEPYVITLEPATAVWFVNP
ncbi:MAG TPA: alpha-amylase family glycosyl hydrolase [Anaerolineales bacterium]|nr:alpha-amylase family glycosyl hydrolase [Anaerolineales bacterium]